MNDYIDQLIKEAEELKRDFRAGAKYGRGMYLSNPLGLALWKQHVLQVLRSFGESNPYYKYLIAVEKIAPQVCLARFSHFSLRR